MELLITTNPGLEPLLAEEVGERCAEAGTAPPHHVQVNPRGIQGVVRVVLDAPVETVWPAVRRLRSAHHVMQAVDDFELQGDGQDALAHIERRVASVTIPGLNASTSFRVTCKRLGRQAFTSQAVQGAAGTGIQRRSGAPVDLEHYGCHVRVDVIGRRCVVGVQLTETSLSKRQPRVFNPGGALLDPYCGAGTILLEAAAVCPGLELYGSDINTRCLEGTSANAEAADSADRLILRRADARHLVDAWGRRRFDWIVTDPPYGVRLGRRWDFKRLYRSLLEQAHEVLKPAGRLALVVHRRGTYERAVAESGLFKVALARTVELGGLTTRFYVMHKQEAQADGRAGI